MLIEQLIELELRGPGSPGSSCTSKTSYFHEKAKIFNAILRVNYYSLLKILQEVM